MRRRLLISLAGALLSCAHVQPKLETVGPADLVRRDFLDGRVTALVPADFVPVSQKPVVATDLIYVHRATVLMDPTGTVRIEVAEDDETQRRAKSDVESPLQQVLALVNHSIRSWPRSAEWLQNELTAIHDRPFLVLDFRTPDGDSRARRLLAMSRVHGQGFVIGFSCTVASESIWAPVGRKVIESVVVRD